MRLTRMFVLAFALNCFAPSPVLGDERDTSLHPLAERFPLEAIPEDVPLRTVPVELWANASQIRAEVASSAARLEMLSSSTATGEVVITLDVVSGDSVTPFEATVDAGANIVTWSGNGAALTPDARDTILRLALELETLVAQGAAPEVEWAYRLTNLWSEAPLDYPLQSRTVVRPAQWVDRPGHIDRERLRAEAEPNEIANNAKTTCAKGCNVSGGDNTYLGGSKKNAGCPFKTYSTKHDACVTNTGKGHCYKTYKTSGGCNRSSKCPGRCGAGCGLLGGFGTYTLDCLDHDYCVAHDGAAACCANDSKCGDEFFEAENDYLFGVFNCDGCK